MNRLRYGIAAVALAAAPAAFAAAGGTHVHSSGTLVDVMCGAEIASQKDADAHTRKCGLMPQCAASGFGIVIDGKFHKFDAEGSKKAEAIVRETAKPDHLAATVDGTLEDDGTITVASLEEVK